MSSGSVADEAARLLEALRDAAATWQHGGDDHEHASPGDPPAACRVCPLCRVIAALQQVKPETVRHLADAAASLTAALSDLVPATGDRTAPASGGPDGAGAERPRRRRRDDVQHIDISD